jgi:hypothetical protein
MLQSGYLPPEEIDGTAFSPPWWRKETPFRNGILAVTE